MILPLDHHSTHEFVVDLLSKDEIAIYPCDTIYGFIGKKGISEDKIKDIKGRGDEKPFILLSTLKLVKTLTTDFIPEDIKALWPGPLTVILNSITGGTIGVRVPNDDNLLRIIESLGAPIYSTSVNRSGMPPMNRIDDIILEFAASVPLIVDGGNIGNATASTILNIAVSPYKVLREGQVSIPDEYLA